SQQDNQDWIPQPIPGDVIGYTLRAEHSGKCLVTDASYASVSQADCTGSVLERWVPVPDADGYVHFVTRDPASHAPSHCLAVNGTSVALASCVPTDDAQLFYWMRSVRRHIMIIQPATSAGLDRFVADPDQMLGYVDYLNRTYARLGIELLYDPAV